MNEPEAPTHAATCHTKNKDDMYVYHYTCNRYTAVVVVLLHICAHSKQRAAMNKYVHTYNNRNKQVERAGL